METTKISSVIMQSLPVCNKTTSLVENKTVSCMQDTLFKIVIVLYVWSKYNTDWLYWACRWLYSWEYSNKLVIRLFLALCIHSADRGMAALTSCLLECTYLILPSDSDSRSACPLSISLARSIDLVYLPPTNLKNSCVNRCVAFK